MKKLHIFGLTIIGLVVAAYINTPEFFNGLDLVLTIKIVTLIILLICIASTTIIRFWFPSIKIPLFFPRILGLFLWIFSGSMFFVDTHYFYSGIELPLPFWHRVSFYTLPAIALESALVTGFEYLMDVLERITPRERSWIISLFSLYTLMTMAINFLAIGEIIPVALHLVIAQVVVVSSVGILLLVLIRKKAPH